MSWRYKNKYGLSEVQVLEMRQRGCEICGSHEKVCIDHNHETGEVRGGLCNQCNMALGLLHDDLGLLKKAIRYLEGA